MTEQTEGQTFTTESDPADFTNDQVNAYLATVTDEDEARRVLEAEKSGQGRVGILDGPHGYADAEGGLKMGQPASDGTTPGLDTSKADTFQEAADKATESEHAAYAQGYFGHVPSRDGDKPVDLTLAGVTGQSDKDA